MSFLVGGGIGLSSLSVPIIFFSMIGVLIVVPLLTMGIVEIINLIRRGRGLSEIGDNRTLPELVAEATAASSNK